MHERGWQCRNKRQKRDESHDDLMWDEMENEGGGRGQDVSHDRGMLAL